MDWREMCVARAADCEEKAKQANDPMLAAVYGALAEQWRELAEHPQPPTFERSSDETE